MNDLLNIVSKHHNDWIRIVKKCGEIEFCEDIVQEMYLKVHKNKDKDVWFKNGQLNVNYIYSILRNICYDLKKQRSKIVKVEIDTLLNFADNDVNLSFDSELDEIIEDEINSWDFYDQKIYEIYILHERSIRKIHRATGISNKSIFLTLKSCKERLKNRINNELNR